jgi:NTE family protein
MNKKNPHEELFMRLFPEVEKEVAQHILESAQLKILSAGELLFKQGDVHRNMYILLKGRLRAISGSSKKLKVLGDIGPGETVGELAFLTNEPRIASVRALRNSLLLEINPEKYMELASSNVKFASHFFKMVVERLRRNTLQQNQNVAPRNIAWIDLHSSADELSTFLSAMRDTFDQMDATLHLHDSPTEAHEEWDALFDKMEDKEGTHLLISDKKNLEWTRQCVIYADLVIVAVPYDADPAIQALEEMLNLYDQHALQKKVYLLLLHDNNAPMPLETSRWLASRPVDLHIHLRKGHDVDMRRFCRIVSHRALGLVLGGGGAKGFAHIGVVEALSEKGIEIDFLGGTSAGALYGIGMAYTDFDFDKIHHINQEAVKGKLTSGDWTLPVMSLMTGKKFKFYLQKMFGQYHMEDIWINTYCLSTDLSKSIPHVHRSGLIWKQVLASMAIPGIFPPVIIDNSLHVDGGVMDNLPIEPMYQYPVSQIIAVSLNSLEVKEVSIPKIPSSWELLWDRLRKKKKYHLPGITSLITHSMIINSKLKQKEAIEKVSDYIELNLKEVKMLDDKNWKEIIQKGYDQTRAYLESKEVQ